jgi:hypothetical protein
MIQREKEKRLQSTLWQQQQQQQQKSNKEFQLLKLADQVFYFILLLTATVLTIMDKDLCQGCQEKEAEIFQDNGDYCLECWQDITHPHI